MDQPTHADAIRAAGREHRCSPLLTCSAAPAAPPAGPNWCPASRYGWPPTTGCWRSRRTRRTHPARRPRRRDMSQAEPRRYPRTDILWATPECTSHSQAPRPPAFRTAARPVRRAAAVRGGRAVAGDHVRSPPVRGGSPVPGAGAGPAAWQRSHAAGRAGPDRRARRGHQRCGDRLMFDRIAKGAEFREPAGAVKADGTQAVTAAPEYELELLKPARDKQGHPPQPRIQVADVLEVGEPFSSRPTLRTTASLVAALQRLRPPASHRSVGVLRPRQWS